MIRWTVSDWIKVALVTALYVAVTMAPGLNSLSSGAIQLRVSELFNFLAFYNKRYIVAVTLGCMIANLMTFGPVDMVVGGLSTLIFVSLGVRLFKRYMSDYWLAGQMNKAFIYFAVFFSVSMLTIALELKLMYQAPFFVTWLTTGVGEFCSLLVGAIIVDKLSKRIDLRK